MYTAKIIKKEVIENLLTLTVEFTNGTDIVVEKCKPQDKAGFEHWVKSRITSLNTLDELKTEDNVGKEVLITEPVVKKTEEELAKEVWDINWSKLQAIQPYIQAGVFTGSETAIVNLKNKVKSGFKPEYLGL